MHRDIKPSNIMFREDGTAVLIDFGIVFYGRENLSLTMTQEALGTPRYMSPEQIEQRPVSASSDIYSLGLTFYEMLVGMPARRAKDLAERAAAVI